MDWIRGGIQTTPNVRSLIITKDSKQVGFACRTAPCRGSLAWGPRVATGPRGSSPTAGGRTAEEPVSSQTPHISC
jgi:hypothetical protein